MSRQIEFPLFEIQRGSERLYLSLEKSRAAFCEQKPITTICGNVIDDEMMEPRKIEPKEIEKITQK